MIGSRISIVMHEFEAPTFRITGPGFDVDERSERATLFRLRFIRLFAGLLGEFR